MEATDTTEDPDGEGPRGAYIRVRWIAAYFDVGPSTIYDLIDSGILPAVAIGRGTKKALRIHRDDFEAYERALREGRTANNDEEAVQKSLTTAS
ncbi:helix-turn-helix domain-containing protein [Streptomyces decoyicus]|uniref:helix-turn-helix domain-containing protein n=1 Tax=Streptomyces decoyicus TaxID=249567 RepID=UPI00382F428A